MNVRLVVLAVVASVLVSCGGGRPAQAPSWARRAIGGDCDLVAMVVLEERKHAHRSVSTHAASLAEMLAGVPVPQGSRLEACARLTPGKAEVAEWLVVVHDVSPEYARTFAKLHDVTKGSGDSIVLGRPGGAKVYLWKNVWAVASAGAAGRIGDLAASDVSSLMETPDAVVAAITVRGEVARRIASRGRGHHVDFLSLLTTDMVEGYADLRHRGDRFELHAFGKYTSPDSARAVHDAIRLVWDALEGGRFGDELAAARRTGTLDLSRSDAEVDATVKISAPSENPPPATTDCPKGQRFDRDQRACVRDL